MFCLLVKEYVGEADLVGIIGICVDLPQPPFWLLDCSLRPPLMRRLVMVKGKLS